MWSTWHVARAGLVVSSVSSCSAKRACFPLEPGSRSVCWHRRTVPGVAVYHQVREKTNKKLLHFSHNLSPAFLGPCFDAGRVDTCLRSQHAQPKMHGPPLSTPRVKDIRAKHFFDMSSSTSHELPLAGIRFACMVVSRRRLVPLRRTSKKQTNRSTRPIAPHH